MLKKVEITGFVGTENDIEFALYILQSAPSLEEMYIKWMCGRRARTTPWSTEMLRMIEKQLQGQGVSKFPTLIIQHNHSVENHGGIGEEDDAI